VISKADFSRAEVNSFHKNSSKALGNSMLPGQVLAYSLKILKIAIPLWYCWRESSASLRLPGIPFLAQWK
jgi:hypothetical protein